MERRKVWTEADIRYKEGIRRFMQVEVDASGTEVDNVRNRLHDALLRKEGRPVSLKDVAKHLNLSRSALYRKLNGERKWTDDEIQKLKKYAKDELLFI